MNNLCFGMKVINISQLPGGSYSHPNGALDMCGSDLGIDYWWAQGHWKCLEGPWGNGTFFFVSCDLNGTPVPVHCADGVDRIVTLALTHSNRKYIRTTKGKVYLNGAAMYEEGTNGSGSNVKISGNHIHVEVAEGVVTSKYYDAKMGVSRMKGELDPLKVFFVRKDFSTVKTALGADKLQYCEKLEYVKPATPKENKGMIVFVAKNCSCRIRESLVFSNGRPSGKILATIPKGGKAEVTHFTERFEGDTYEWAQVRYTTPTGTIVNGYVQLDLQSYLLKKE